MTRTRRQLGAITGERLEYRLPASVFTKISKGTHAASCYPDAEALLRYAMQKTAWVKAKAVSADRVAEMYKATTAEARFKKRGKTAAKQASTMEGFLGALQVEIYKLRAKGTKGRIPVCLYRSSGKVSEYPRETRRSTATHERFHADVRRAEERLGARLDEANCNLQAREALAEVGPATKAALRFSRLASWGTPLEELLARTEEIRKSCLKGEKSCEETKARFRKTVLNYSLRVDRNLADNPGVLADAESEIRARYGSAMGFVTQALRNPTCKVRR